MSLTYRSNTYKSGRKVKPSVKLRNDLSDVYQQKQEQYNQLHSELSTDENVNLHDSHLTEDNDAKLVRLSSLRDELIRLEGQLEVLALV